MSKVIESIQESNCFLDIYSDGDVLVTAVRSGYFVLTAELIKRLTLVHQKHERAKNKAEPETAAKAKPNTKNKPAANLLTEKPQKTKPAARKHTLKNNSKSQLLVSRT